MFKRFQHSLILFLIPITFFISGTPASSQCGVPPDRIDVTTYDGHELEVLFYSHGSLNILSDDGFSISISPAQGGIGNTRFSIVNSGWPHDWGTGILEISTGWGTQPLLDGEFDSSILPESYRVLWDRLRATCGDLLANEEFYEKASGLGKDTVGELLLNIEQMRDGHYTASINTTAHMVQYFMGTRYDVDGLARGFRLSGPLNLNILTTSPFESEEPDLLVSMMGNLPEDRWHLVIDPGAEIATIEWDGNSPGIDQSEIAWEQSLADIRDCLIFFKNNMPLLEEYDAGWHLDELDFMLDRCLLATETYEIIPVAPEAAPEEDIVTEGGDE